MLNTHKDWMAGKSATVNNKDDLILSSRPVGRTNDVPNWRQVTNRKIITEIKIL